MLRGLEQELRRTRDPLDLERAGVISEMLKSRGSDIPLSSFATPERALNIPEVSEAMYMQTREALAKEGYTFVVDILPVSIGQLATDEKTSQRFGYVNSSENMRSIVPPRMEVAINPNNLRIKNSNSKSTDDQIRMLEKEEAVLTAKLPQGIKDIISIRIQNASVLAQLDNQYQKETGKVLFTDWFGRTNDQTVPGYVALVGRDVLTSGLGVDDWSRGSGVSVSLQFPW